MSVDYVLMAKILRGIESGATTLGPIFGGIGEAVALVVAAGAGLGADLADQNMPPHRAIARIRDCIPDFDRVATALDEFARTGQ